MTIADRLIVPLMRLEALLPMTQVPNLMSVNRVPTLDAHGEGPPH